MGRKPSGRPTSFDIAYLAGVSQPTVSRALRGSKSVSAATRQRIEQIASELNYTVDKHASSLRSQRADTIALLFFEDPTPDDSMINPFFLAMLGSITRQCANRGLDLLISFQRMEDDWHVAYQDSHKADGLLLLGYGDYTAYQARLTHLLEQGTHFVRWGSVDAGMIGPTVGSDNFGAGKLAGEHLAGLHCRRVAFLGHADEHYPEFADRYRGLCAALADARLGQGPIHQIDAITTEEAGYAACCDLLRRDAQFDAIFAASDLIALGAMRALGEAGKRVPHDVKIVGFDDIPAASMANPPLTTIVQDVNRAGELLVESLMAHLEERDPPPPTLPAHLAIRGSTAG